MLLAVEGPNGVGKTTFLEKLTAELSKYGLTAEVVKLKPDFTGKRITQCVKDAFLYREDKGEFFNATPFVADYSVTGLTRLFMLEFIDKMPYLTLGADNSIIVLDRSIISTYIYGIASYYYLCNNIPNFRHTNVFTRDVDLGYGYEPLSDKEFYTNILQTFADYKDAFEVSRTILLLPSNLTNIGPWLKSSINRDKGPEVVYQIPHIYRHVCRMYHDLEKEMCKKDKSDILFTKMLLDSFGLGGKDGFKSYRVKQDYSNMDKIVEKEADRIWRLYSSNNKDKKDIKCKN